MLPEEIIRKKISTLEEEYESMFSGLISTPGELIKVSTTLNTLRWVTEQETGEQRQAKMETMHQQEVHRQRFIRNKNDYNTEV